MARKKATSDEKIDADVSAPDTHTNGVAEKRINLDSGEPIARDDDDAEEDDERYAAEIDGEEAVIDTRIPAQVTRPSHEALMNALTAARHDLERKVTLETAAKAAKKLSQMSVDGIVAQLAVSWEDRAQLELPLTEETPAGPCANCGQRDGAIPLRSGEKWCIPCVQINLEPADEPVREEELAAV
jgi:hypothetical protein